MNCDICEKDKGLMLKIELLKNGRKIDIESYFYEPEGGKIPDHFPNYVLICKECVINWIFKSEFINGFNDFDEFIVSLLGTSLEEFKK